MSENNNNNTIKILIAIIISLSMVIVFSGVLYILNMQNKIAKLETEQKEQLKQQLEIPNTPSTEIVEPQNTTETQEQIGQTQEKNIQTTSNKSSSGNTKKRNSNQQEVNTQEIERIIDDTINKIDRQNNNSNSSQNSKKEEDKLTRNIESVMGE